MISSGWSNIQLPNPNSQTTPGPANSECGPKPHWNPYLAGLMLGGALLASFLILGAGLGAWLALRGPLAARIFGSDAAG